MHYWLHTLANNKGCMSHKTKVGVFYLYLCQRHDRYRRSNKEGCIEYFL